MATVDFLYHENPPTLAGHGQGAMDMNRYTNTELVYVHFICGLANGNGRAAVRLYGERYLTRRQPNPQTFTRVHQNLEEHGSFRTLIEDTGWPRTA
ncbi:hypothetical protein TNCV_4714571 [Trichonephila clavipes]|nr:hypothetical protein TNCV_4714571 [Trichonephila clavipes]